ncbi:MAG: hypothetical protein IPM39_28500 [Chloroflexi bacterium]|nr:hypothetical protein [Chloroflexota bacterium]
MNGRIRTRQVFLGPAGSVTKEPLWAKSLELERRLTVFRRGYGNLGRINQSRQVMFGVIERSRVGARNVARSCLRSGCPKPETMVCVWGIG